MPGKALCGKGQRSEERCGFILQDADDEWVMMCDCPEIGGGEGEEKLKAENRKLKYEATRRGRGTKAGRFLSSLTGLMSLRSGQPTVGNGGLLSAVPAGLQRRGNSRAFPGRQR